MDLVTSNMDYVTSNMMERLSPTFTTSLTPSSSSSLNPSSHRTNVTIDTNNDVRREIFQTDISNLVDLKIPNTNISMKNILSPASTNSLRPSSSSSLNPSSHRTNVTIDTNNDVNREIFQTEISHLVDLKIPKDPVDIKIHNADDKTKIVNNPKLDSPREEMKNDQDISNLVDLKIVKLKDMKVSPQYSTSKNKDSPVR